MCFQVVYFLPIACYSIPYYNSIKEKIREPHYAPIVTVIFTLFGSFLPFIDLPRSQAASKKVSLTFVAEPLISFCGRATQIASWVLPPSFY